MRKYSLVGPLVASALPYILFECLRNGLIEDRYIMLPKGHFYIVSVVAFLASIIAIAVGIAGNRLRNIKVSFLALAFISLALVFALHGLSTPHFLLPETHLPPITAQLSLLLATIWIWLSSLPSDHKWVARLSNQQNKLLPVWMTALIVFGIVTMYFPQILSYIPLSSEPLNWIVTAIIILLNIVTINRYYQTYRFSRFPLQLAIVYSSSWFIVSQLIIVLGETWMLSWWLYHFLLLASVVVMLIGLVEQYAVKRNFSGAIRALFTNDPLERITNSITPSIKAQIIAIEKKDTYTVGHTLRVSIYALKLAEELRLNPEQLRAIAQGALIHDVGKIRIPDSVLNKPGNLSTEEKTLVEMHPVNGYDMCRELGFLKEELSIIRSHHEKWDGSGYPDMLQGEEIPFIARIVAVTDVYDALTSERSYRNAWSHDEAMKFLIEQKAKQFDPKCVDAWVNLCERNPSVYQHPSTTITINTTGELLSSI